MSEERNVQELYDRLMEYENSQHEVNQKRIKTGIILLWIIPLVFLVLLFITKSSKPIFLTLWIVSLFLIAIYLIYVEYTDYKLQEKMNEINGREEKIDSLFPVDAMEERVIAATEFLEERAETREKEKQERREEKQERREEIKEKASEKKAEIVARHAKKFGRGTDTDTSEEGADGANKEDAE